MQTRRGRRPSSHRLAIVVRTAPDASCPGRGAGGGPVTCGYALKVGPSALVNGLEIETTSVTYCSLTITERTSAQVRVVVRGGVEPPTFRFSGAFAASLDVAECGLMGHLAAATMARCRLMWPDGCRRWLGGLAPLNRRSRAGRRGADDRGRAGDRDRSGSPSPARRPRWQRR